MEELIERVSDIAMSPVRRDIRHYRYRHILWLLLLYFAIPINFLCAKEFASPDKVSRREFVNYIYERLYNINLKDTEIEKTGILDLFQDGKIHSEWPITRRVAAEALYRVSLISGSAAKLPRTFADVDAKSSLYNVLQCVGGGFMPKHQGKFEPDKLLTPSHLRQAISVLMMKSILKSSGNNNGKYLPVYISPDDQYKKIKPVYIEPEFKDKPHSNDKYIKHALKRLDTANSLDISTQQMNPQTISNINEASEAMKEVKRQLKRFGGSVLELSEISVNSPQDDRAVCNALKQFSTMLSDFSDRFTYCKIQLESLTIADPEQINRCSVLNSEINESMREISILQQRISERLKESKQSETMGEDTL